MLPDSLKPTDPLWYKDAVFYEVFVRAFADSNGDGVCDNLGTMAQNRGGNMGAMRGGMRGNR